MHRSFWETVQERVLIADGAMGSEIYSRGFFVNCCYDELNLTGSHTIQDIHEQFAKAGAEILTTNTFGANRILLNAYGLSEKIVEINQRGVQLAKEVAGDSLFVAGSIGPISDELYEHEDPQTLCEV